MRKILMIMLSFTLCFITSCDSAEDDDPVETSDLQGLWQQTEVCYEFRSCISENNGKQCESAVDLNSFLMINNSTLLNCQNDPDPIVDDCSFLYFELDDSRVEICEDDPNCEEYENSLDCSSNYRCAWNDDFETCYWTLNEQDICQERILSLGKTNQTLSAKLDLELNDEEISEHGEDCEIIFEENFQRIGDTFEDLYRDCPIEGTWGLTSFDYSYSDECTNGGQDGSADLACLTVIVADGVVVWDFCDCEGVDELNCIEEDDIGYTCYNPIIEDNVEIILEDYTATYILIEPIEDFLFYDKGDYGDNCKITSTMAFERK